MVNHPNNKTKTSTASNHNLVGHRIDQGRLEFMSVLGLGAYGVVYLARDLTSADKENPKLYAVKALNKIGLDARQKSFQRREIALHSLASSHPSIVTLHAVIESPSCIFVILDYCPDGDLFGMITEKQRYLGQTEALKRVFIQIIEAVQFCHQLGISHRDLKPENILCKRGGDEVVLADFGLATAEKKSSDFGCGSTFYMSPECQGGLFERLGTYSTLHNDIWSLGVILVNLTCGRNPWKQACPSDETFRAYLANPEFLRSILPISESCNSILKRIFALNPIARISLEELKVEISRVENFNMTTAELNKATRATREAARAWRKDLLPSPKVQPQLIIESSQNKNVAPKKPAPPVQPQPKPVQASSSKSSAVARAEIWKKPVRYEESCSSNSVYFTDSNATPSVWSLGPRKTSEVPGGLPPDSRFGSPLPPFFIKPQESSPRIRFVKPRANNEVAPSQGSHTEAVPTGPLVTAFTSASISKASSASSDEHSKRPRGFSSRFRKLSNAASTTFHQLSKEEVKNSSGRKKLFSKPISFNRPNAPSPIIVKPFTSGSSSTTPTPQPRTSSPHVGGMITPTNKKGKQSILTFLPSTPPPSVSPGSATFGFIKKPSRFFHSNPHHSNPALPPTPSTPNHPTKPEQPPSCSSSSGSSTRDARRTPPSSRSSEVNSRKLPRSPLSVIPQLQQQKKKKVYDPNQFSLFNSSDEESSDQDMDEGGLIDEDFDVDEEDTNDDEDEDEDEDEDDGDGPRRRIQNGKDAKLPIATTPTPASRTRHHHEDYRQSYVAYAEWLSKNESEGNSQLSRGLKKTTRT